MVRKMMTVWFLGAVLGVGVAVAQEPTEAQKKPLRFDAMVKVSGFLDSAPEGVQVQKPGEKEAQAVIPGKAYPYGSRFTVSSGTKFRLSFADLTYVICRGPATFVPQAEDEWRKVSLNAERGDFNFSVDDRALDGQFQAVTPLGTFASMKGRSRLHVGVIQDPKAWKQDATQAKVQEDFAFRILSGSAVFKGLHYTMTDLSQANAFTTSDAAGMVASMKGRSRLHVGVIQDPKAWKQDATQAKVQEDFAFRILSGSAVFKGLHYTMTDLSQANAFTTSDAAGMVATDVTGKTGEVKMELPTGAGKSTPFSLTPGATVKVMRAKARASDNWVVSVLTLYANGEAQNYFCYVENRGDGFRTGELIAEVNPADEEEATSEDAGEAEAEGESGSGAMDDLNDFDDGELL